MKEAGDEDEGKRKYMNKLLQAHVLPKHTHLPTEIKRFSFA